MKKATKAQRIRKCLIGLVGVYLIVTLMLFLDQRNLLYYPNRPDAKPVPAPSKVGLDMQVVQVTTADNLKLVAWFTPPKKKGGPVVVVYHGNAANIAYRWPIAKAMIEKGYGVFMSEYRGFGGNAGSPNEEGLYTDARAALKWLDAKGYKPKQLVYYGESLGTGVTVQMAMETPPAMVVLQSSFNSLVDVAAVHFWYLPVSLLLLDRFDSVSKIGKIKVPVLVIHGDRDALISSSIARKLYDAANEPKAFMLAKGAGHNDVYDFGGGPMITGWIEKQLKNH